MLEILEESLISSSQVGQKVVYSILKKFLNYLCIAKLFEYKKKVTIIFAKVKYFVQHFQVAVIKYKII